MPCTICKVLVQVGQSIRNDDILFISEAMKMELEIRAGVEGVETEILTKKGHLWKRDRSWHRFAWKVSASDAITMKCNLIRLGKAANFGAPWPELQSAQIDFMWKHYFEKKKSNSSGLTQTMLKTLLSRQYAERDVEIIHLPGGKPEAIISCVGRKTVSATHSGKYVAVCTAKVQFLGIDVQVPVDWGDKNKRLVAFTSRELHCISTNVPPAQYFEGLTTLWTAKEAICKALGVGLSKGFHYVEILTDLRTDCEIFLRDNTQWQLVEPVLYVSKLGDAACSVFSAQSTGTQEGA